MSLTSTNKRSVTLGGRNTSVTVSVKGWQQIKVIAAGRNLSRPALVEVINNERHGSGTLSGALRRFVRLHGARAEVAARLGVQKAA